MGWDVMVHLEEWSNRVRQSSESIKWVIISFDCVFLAGGRVYVMQ